jgi:hypothetical protein
MHHVAPDDVEANVFAGQGEQRYAGNGLYCPAGQDTHAVCGGDDNIQQHLE